MSREEKIVVNLYQSDEPVPAELTQQDTNLLLKNLYGALTKYVASKGFGIFPHRPGVRFFIEDNATFLKCKGNAFVQVQQWSGGINEIRFHDGFVAQFDFIDNKIWLKIDARQLVLLKGNQQDNRDFSGRSFYVSYCAFCDCRNRPQCLVARTKTLRSVQFVTTENELISLRESLGYGCKFYSILKKPHDAVKADSQHVSILLPWSMIYFKGAMADMPDSSMRRLYRERCLLKSEDRLALNNFAFSVLSGSGKVIDLPFGNERNKISFRNMFEGRVEI